MCAKNADWLTGLHQQRLVVLQFPERAYDGVERSPIPRCAPGAAVDDQLIRLFSHLRIEVVHQHPERGFLMPALARDFAPSRRANNRRRMIHDSDVLLAGNYFFMLLTNATTLSRSAPATACAFILPLPSVITFFKS